MQIVTRKNTIGSGQFFCLLYVSHAINILMTTPGIQTAGGMEHLLWSVPLSVVGSIVLALPFWWMHRRYRAWGIGELSVAVLGKGFALPILLGYVVLYLYHSAVSVVQYQLFVMDTMLPQVSVWILTTAILVTACYGAMLGIEALARASGFFLAIIFVSLLVIFCALFPKVTWEHFSPVKDINFSEIARKSVATTTWMLEIGTMAVIFPYVHGKIGRNLLVWSVGEGLTLAVVAFLTVGVLGEYLGTQMFPFYTVASMAEIGSLQRQDALFVGVWTMGLYVRVALFLVAASLCVTSFFGEKAGRWALFVGGGLVWGGSLVLLRYPQVIQTLSSLQNAGLTAGVFFFLLPLILLLIASLKKVDSSSGKEKTVS